MKWPSGERMTVREWLCHRLPYSTTRAFFGQRVLVLYANRRVYVRRVKRGWTLP